MLGVMDVVARSSSEPALHFGMLVGCVVVHDQMNIKRFGDVGVNMSQELQELLMSMAAFIPTDDFSRGNIQGREQGGGAVADVIVSHTFDIAQPQRQHGLRSIQCLNLTFFVNAQNHCLVGRIEIQADDITNLFDEKWISVQFEMFLAMGLNPKGLPDPLNRGFGQVRLRCDRTARPVSSIPGFGFECFAN